MNYLKQFYWFLQDLVKSKDVLLKMTKRDFKSKYLGSLLGFSWMFVHPVITILIFWFVFEVGFKVKPVPGTGIPFVPWLIAGMAPWFLFSDSWLRATNSVIEDSFLVKKVVFRVSTLPIVKLLSALLVHIFFIMLLLIIFILYRFPLSIYNLQFFYYLFAMVVLLLGLSWITSSLIIFLRDVGQVVSIMLQFGFWLSAIFWPIGILPLKYQKFIKLNPVYYIIQGYRDTFINKTWFWEHGWLTLYFWCIALCLFVCGALLFRKLRPHFADVL